jgi:pyridoxamine 5'-phosphate oxidase
MEADHEINPLDQFEAYFQEARRAGEPEPEAMVLSTVSHLGEPHSRVVLFRGRNAESIQFFTNYESLKGKDLAQRPIASLVFYWSTLGRQIRMQGRVEKTSAEESDRYWKSRPRGHQLNAWTSRQSQEIQSLDELIQKRRELELKWNGIDIPRPPYWGGFRFIPNEIEFWKAGGDRFHERRVFQKCDPNVWKRILLSP